MGVYPLARGGPAAPTRDHCGRWAGFGGGSDAEKRGECGSGLKGEGGGGAIWEGWGRGRGRGGEEEEGDLVARLVPALVDALEERGLWEEDMRAVIEAVVEAHK